jgi:DNA-binding HxlR family transcriptional regulator
VSAELARAVARVRTSPMHAVIDLVGDVWTLRMLREAAAGANRFEHFVNALALPRATLASRLERLTAGRLLDADYGLTESGRDAIGTVLLLQQWDDRYVARASLPRHRCGKRLTLSLGCRRCGGAVTTASVKALDFPAPRRDPSPALPRYRRQRSELAEVLTAEHCLGDRWLALVLGAMLFGLGRFRDLVLALDIAPNVLSHRQKLLLTNEIAARAADDERLVLTRKGRALFPAIVALAAWGERWLTPRWRTRAGFDLLHRPCGEWLSSRLACASCDEELQLADLRWPRLPRAQHAR